MHRAERFNFMGCLYRNKAASILEEKKIMTCLDFLYPFL